MLKRANGEVKIGNKNKIAPAALVVCVGNKASLRPAGRAPLSPSQMRNVSPPPCPAATRTSASHPGPRAGPASKRHQRTGFAQRCCPPAVWPPTRSRAPSRRLSFLSSSRSADPPGTDGGGGAAPKTPPQREGPMGPATHVSLSGSPPGPSPCAGSLCPKVGRQEGTHHTSERPSLALSSDLNFLNYTIRGSLPS